jgi:hypothetical protein
MAIPRPAAIWRRSSLWLALAVSTITGGTQLATASDELLCVTADVCGEGCADDYSGPLTGPIYEPTEPMTSETIEPFVQPTTPPTTQALFAEGVEGTLGSPAHAPGYIDWAVPRSQIRLRFDAGFDSNRPDRAEFFYAQYQNPGPGDLGQGVVNTRVNFQDIRAYLELASGNRFSVFAEVPVRFIQTDSQTGRGLRDSGDANGISDLEAGFKYAISTDPTHFVTFQLKTYIPTGNASDGLGTDHVSIEPGILFNSKVNSRLDVFGEIRDWIPVNGSSINGIDYSGNVLRYGVGAAYTVARNESVSVSPIVEFVGWSVLDGQVFDANRLANRDADTTIVNAKVGVRTMFHSNDSSLYVGYGNALTGQRWYENFLRVEYTIFL